MPRVSDLVSDSKLVTRFEQNDPVHTYDEVTHGRRRVIRQERWAHERHLGEGGSGKVWLETCTQGNSQGMLRAIKMVPKQRSPSHSIDYNRELEAVAKFSHRKYEACFVKSYGWYESTRAIYIAMEYLPRGDLHLYLSHTSSMLPQDEARQVTHQILEGLESMHANGFAHRDVKPSNVLIKSHPPDDWWIKLSDFGISKRAEDENGPSTIKGTRGFMAPELQGFQDNPLRATRPDFQAADMWALGEVTFRMLSGGHAFPNQQAFALYCLGEDKCPSTRLIDATSESAAEFVSALMAVKPQDRPKASKAITHLWLSSLRRDVEICPLHVGGLDVSIKQDNRAASFHEPAVGLVEDASKRWTAFTETGFGDSVFPLSPEMYQFAKVPNRESADYLRAQSNASTESSRTTIKASPRDRRNDLGSPAVQPSNPRGPVQGGSGVLPLRNLSKGRLSTPDISGERNTELKGPLTHAKHASLRKLWNILDGRPMLRDFGEGFL